MTKDTVNLRHEADYCVEVYPGVFWVPANSLGRSRYTEDDIQKLTKLSPEEKQNSIATLYEAIQLYQVSRFQGYIDNVRVMEEYTTVMWVFHKPGFHAVRTNGGCCAADTNWLSYILKDKYREIGCFGLYQDDGNGHIISYIRQNDAYYFVDMMPQRYDQLSAAGAEDGDIHSFNRSYFQSYIYKTNGFDGFIRFYRERSPHKPHLFYYKPGDCYGIGNQFVWKGMDGLSGLAPDPSNQCIFLKNTVEILFSETDDAYRMSDFAALEPNWSLLPPFAF